MLVYTNYVSIYILMLVYIQVYTYTFQSTPNLLGVNAACAQSVVGPVL